MVEISTESDDEPQEYDDDSDEVFDDPVLENERGGFTLSEDEWRDLIYQNDQEVMRLSEPGYRTTASAAQLPNGRYVVALGHSLPELWPDQAAGTFEVVGGGRGDAHIIDLYQSARGGEVVEISNALRQLGPFVVHVHGPEYPR